MIFYKGELVSERRFFNDRLAMFLMRYREPTRYGKWHDQAISQRAPDGASQSLADAVHHLMEDATADELGTARPVRPPIVLQRTIHEQEWADERRPREKPIKGGRSVRFVRFRAAPGEKFTPPVTLLPASANRCLESGPGAV